MNYGSVLFLFVLLIETHWIFYIAETFSMIREMRDSRSVLIGDSRNCISLSYNELLSELRSSASKLFEVVLLVSYLFLFS